MKYFIHQLIINSIYYIGLNLYSNNKELSNSKAYNINGKYVWAFHFISDDEVILGFQPFQIYNLKTKKIRNLKKQIIQNNSLVYRFFNDNENSIWAVATNGLYRIKNEEVIDYFGNDANDEKHKIPTKDILDAHLDNNGIFWISTYGEGLFRWDTKNHTFKNFTIQNGFPSNIMVRIESDDFGYLWISTENGLCRFNKQSYTINTFTTKDGLSHNEFNRISSFKAKNGKLYFGGLNGVIGFNPKDFLNEKTFFSFPIQVINFSQFDGKSEKIVDKTIEFNNNNKNKNIVLNPNDRFCELTFQFLNYEERTF